MNCCPVCGWPMKLGPVDGLDWECTMCHAFWESADAVRCEMAGCERRDRAAELVASWVGDD